VKANGFPGGNPSAVCCTSRNLQIPEDRPQQLNPIFLRGGRLPEPGSNNEVVVGEAFAAAHAFNPGDTIEATIHGARQQLRIVGLGLSPEYVYETPPGESVSDSRRFGVFWMNERGLAIALTLNGAFNNVVAEVASGADRRAVMAEMDRILRNFERKPWQAFFTALGLAFATGIPIVPGAIRDGIAYLSDFQWGLAQGQDVTLGIRTLAALFILREEVLKPLLAGLCWPKRGRPPKNVHPLDIHYQTLQRQMLSTLQYLKLAA
jgi:hypothetical protein